jgi:hypothetical protein
VGKKLGTVTIDVLIIGEPENRKELGTVAISVLIIGKEMGTVGCDPCTDHRGAGC